MAVTFCPFCGENPFLAKLKSGGHLKSKAYYSIACKNIKCQVRPYLDRYDKNKLIEAWNQRVDNKI